MKREINMEKLKELELAILDKFIEICDVNNLHYFLVGGSCLGAVRHNGFIPWDDDIDVAMPRPDYDEFIKIAQQYLPENLFLQCYKNEPDYRLDFAKIRNSNSTFIESSSRKLNINKGIYIDIFPIDGMPFKKAEKRSLQLHKSLAKLYLGKDYCRTEQSVAKWILYKMAVFVARVVYLFKTTQQVQAELENHYRKFNYYDCANVVIHGGAWKKKEIHPREQYGTGINAKFEGRNVIIPEKAEQYLKSQYGDWQKLPPEEKRVTHHFYDVIDTEKSYKYYVGENRK